MKCRFCDKTASICFSNWPEQGDLCLCEEHCTETHLWQVQQLLREKGHHASLEEMTALARKVG